MIAYRPDYIGPTDEEAHFGQSLLYWFFAPIGAAVKAEQIGEAMIEVTARSDEFVNGDKLGTRTSFGTAMRMTASKPHQSSPGRAVDPSAVDRLAEVVPTERLSRSAQHEVIKPHHLHVDHLENTAGAGLSSSTATALISG